MDKHDKDTIELKWGQDAKSIGGEIKVDSLERGYIVTRNPKKKRSPGSI